MEKFDKKIILYFKGPTQTCRIMDGYTYLCVIIVVLNSIL